MKSVSIHQLVKRLIPIWWRWLPLWMMLIFLATTPYTTMQRGFWTDEFFTATYTQHTTIGQVLEDVRKNEESPPLYFLFLWLWMRVVGGGEVAMRFPSVLSGMLSVGLLTFLAQRWLSQKAALIAGIVVSLSPLIARYAMEARPYSMLVFVSIGCIAAFEYLYRHPDKRIAQIFYPITAAALFLTSYFGIAILASHHLIWLARLFQERTHWKRRLLSWLVIQLAIGVILMAWLSALLYQIQVGPDVSLPHITMPQEENHTRLLLLALSLVAYTESSVTLFPLVIFALLWCLFLYGFMHTLSNQNYRGIILRIVAIPIVMMIAVMFVLEVSSPRYFMVMIPEVAIGVAIGWSTLHQRSPRIGRIIGVVIFLLLLFYRLPDILHSPPVQNPWKEITAFVARQAHPVHDVVVVYPPFELRSFTYYHDERDGPIPHALGAYHYDDFYSVQKHDLATDWTVEQIVQETQGYQHLWLIFRPYYGQPHPHQLPYQLLGHWKSGGVEIFKYNVSEHGSPQNHPGVTR